VGAQFTLLNMPVELFFNFDSHLFTTFDIHAIIMVGLIGPTLGDYFVLAYAMLGSEVDYDEMFTNNRREAIYYDTFSFSAGLGSSIAALFLP
jgi:Na+/melibiose symporter-like transporter